MQLTLNYSGRRVTSMLGGFEKVFFHGTEIIDPNTLPASWVDGTGSCHQGMFEGNSDNLPMKTIFTIDFLQVSQSPTT